jgi:hypothetical protein
MGRMKQAQRDRKKKEGDQIVYAQADASSISSSDEEELMLWNRLKRTRKRRRDIRGLLINLNRMRD